MSRTTGSTISGCWYGYMEYTKTETATTVTVKVTEVGVHCSTAYRTDNFAAKLVGTSTYSTSGKSTNGEKRDFPLLTTDRTFTFTKGASATSKTISFSVTCTGTLYPGTSKNSITVSIPAGYTAPSVKCKAYRVSASANGPNGVDGYAPDVDPTGTRGYYEITLSGGKNWTVASGHKLTIGGIEYSIARNGTTNTFYGYTDPGAVAEGARQTATAIIKLTALGTGKSVTGTTYIAPISNMIDITPNCVAIGKSATDGYKNMTFEVGCPMRLYGHDAPVGTVLTESTDTAATMSTTGSWVSKKSVCSLVLTPGTWVIKVHAAFRGYTTATGTTSASAGYRIVGVGYESGSGSSGTSAGSRSDVYATSGRAAYVQSVIIRELTYTNEVYPLVQTSTQVGFSSARIEAVRIA